MLLSHQDSGVSKLFDCPVLSSLDQVESWLRENYSQLVAETQVA
jgi:hypothetical protein